MDPELGTKIRVPSCDITLSLRLVQNLGLVTMVQLQLHGTRRATGMSVLGDLQLAARLLNCRSTGQLQLCLSKLPNGLLRAMSSP